MLENRIEKYWDKRADSYNEVVQKEMACQKKDAWESLLQKYVGSEENLKVLDVGTGPGFFAILLAGLNYSVSAVAILAKSSKSHESDSLKSDSWLLLFKESVILSQNQTFQ